jgi:hypothetical protein
MLIDKMNNNFIIISILLVGGYYDKSGKKVFDRYVLFYFLPVDWVCLWVANLEYGKGR